MTMKLYKRSPLAFAVLALLIEAPMHPYRMQQLIKSRGKDQVINVRLRATLYQTIERLERDGLIAASQIEKGEGKPDRTIYEITPVGHRAGIAWLRSMLAEPENEFPEFPVAIAFLGLITPQETAALLEARLGFLAGREKKLSADLETYQPLLPRMLLLENEYQLAILRAERQWVEQVVSDLRAGALDWNEMMLMQISKAFEDNSHSGGT